MSDPVERKPAWAVALITLLCAAGAMAAALQLDLVREQIWPRVQQEFRHSPDYSLRRMTLDRRDRALAAGDLVEVAEIHAELAHEATSRARAVLDAWMTLRDPETLLFPNDLARGNWTYRDTAADLFCFLFLAAHRTDAESLSALRDTIEAERKLAEMGDLCLSVDADSLRPVRTGARERMFGASEYAKDGLLGLLERTGDAQVRARLLEVTDTILARSRHKSQFGPIPAGTSEVNGEMLQTLSRLACLAPDGAYGEMAARIADAITLQMLPHNHGLPAKEYDYAEDEPERGFVQLRDHGNEVIVGLGEVYALAVARSPDPLWRSRAARWAEPTCRMYELLLEYGPNQQGLLVNQLDPGTLEPRNEWPSDNWGYVLCGAVAFADAAGQSGDIAPARLDAMLARVDAITRAVAATDGMPWEGAHHDGYADSLESAIYLSAYRPQTAPHLLPWVDDQIDIFYHWQRSDGFVDKGYLDGNFIRTCLLYADARSGGWRVAPWSPDVRVGWAAGAGGEMVIVVRADADYTGILRPESRRHAEIMNLPTDWARINSWPQWAPHEEISEVVEAEGLTSTPEPDDLGAGLPVTLRAGERIVLRLRAADPAAAHPPQ